MKSRVFNPTFQDKYIPTDWVTLYERLYCFYLYWSDGQFINAYNEILPLNKARELKEYEIMVGQQAVDIYTGLNVMLFLLAINSYAQGQESLKEKIYFHPCGDHNNEGEFDRSRLLKIMGYGECLGVGTFKSKLGKFLRNTNLRNANLSYADLLNANLRNSDLRNADLSYADLLNANLSYINLSYANLTNANLSYANLTNANLTNANLNNSYLTNANLNNSYLTNANLEDIKYNQYTNWEEVKGLETARNVSDALREQLQL